MTIHAYTELGVGSPAYINLSERVSNPGDVIVTVRSSGESNSSSIILTPEQLRNLSIDIDKHLGGAGNVSAVATNLETITFDQFVQYGRDNGGNIVGGMPWSFSFRGHPVTHENDRRYIIGNGTLDGLNFTADDVLVVNPDGSLATIRAEPVGI